MKKALILEARFYKCIAAEMLATSKKKLQESKIDYDVISLSGAFELPNAANMILELCDYRGIIVLGCIIKGKTKHYDIISLECSRMLNELAIHYSMPLGFGLIMANDLSEASARSVKYALHATQACLELMEIKDRLRGG